MNVRAAIYSHLSGYAGLTALVSKRIYPGVLPQNCPYPAVNFFLVSSDPVEVMGGPSGMDIPYVQVSVRDTTIDGAAAVADQVKAAMRSTWGAWGSATVHYSGLRNEHDLYEPETGTFHIALDFEITIEE